jgi:hypothetical protein
MIKTDVKFGILTGFAVCTWILTEFFLGFHTMRLSIGEYSSYFAVIIPMITLYFGIKEKRDHYYGGRITITAGIRTGLMISVISAIITTLFLIVYYNYINPDFIQIGLAFQKHRLMITGRTDLEIIKEMENIRAIFSFTHQILYGILSTIGIGFVLSLAISFILKKRASSEFSAFQNTWFI